MGLIRSAMSSPATVMVAVVSIVLASVLAISRMKVDVLPDLNSPVSGRCHSAHADCIFPIGEAIAHCFISGACHHGRCAACTAAHKHYGERAVIHGSHHGCWGWCGEFHSGSQEERRMDGEPVEEAALEGAASCLRPVLMTSIASIKLASATDVGTKENESGGK